ncbi:hypothetical protein ACFX1Z_019257 [Malus domestica]
MNDTALLHCERMDVHVSLGTCGPLTFRQLAKNYLRLDAHPLFEAVDWCVRSGGVLTPTQIGEILLRNKMDADVAMKEVVLAMQARINLGVGGGSRDQLAELKVAFRIHPLEEMMELGFDLDGSGKKQVRELTVEARIFLLLPPCGVLEEMMMPLGTVESPVAGSTSTRLNLLIRNTLITT